MSPYRLSNYGRIATNTTNYRGILAGNIGRYSPILLVGNSGTPYITTYAWSNTTGFGAKAGNPGTIPSGKIFDIDSSGTEIFYAVEGSPYVLAYTMLGGPNTKYADPSTLPSFYSYGVSYNATAATVTVANYSSPYVVAYPWSSGGFGAKYADPASLPGTKGLAVKFNNAGTVLAVQHLTSPYISMYNWSSGFGTKFSNPATLPPDPTYDGGLAFTSNDSAVALAIGSFGGEYVVAYPWSNSTGFGTKYTAPATMPGYDARDVVFSPNNSNIAVSTAGSGTYVYPWSPGFGTKYANAATHYSDTHQASFNSSSSVIALGLNATPYVAAYNWSSGFGTKFSDPSSPPTSAGTAVKFLGI